ncbi:MAG: hypothetical protein WCQ64_07520 [Acidobacteriota bacterium]
MRIRVIGVAACVLACSVLMLAQGQGAPAQGARGQGQGAAPQGTNFPGGVMSADGELMAARPSTTLFSQEAYTQYEILEPGTEQFAITYLLENAIVGATTISNATRKGSEGTNISVFDPRTGQPLKFTYDEQPNGDHAIKATLLSPIPEGGIGRVLIYKTYKDARTYQMNGDNLVWVRSLAGYRLGVVLPKGFAFTSMNVAAQMSTTADGRLKLAFASPHGGSNLMTIHAHKTTATFTPSPFTDMFFDDIKTLYTLDAPETGNIAVEQTYSDTRKGETATLNSLEYMAINNLKVVDLDTAKALPTTKRGDSTSVKLDVPIVNDKQSAHLRLTGTIHDGTYRMEDGVLVFQRTVRGLRNTVILPAGYEVSAVSQSATIGATRETVPRVFVQLVNLNGENSYRVTIRAKKK